MKKTLLAGAIAALALFGCSTDEVNYDRYSLVEDVAPDVAQFFDTIPINKKINGIADVRPGGSGNIFQRLARALMKRNRARFEHFLQNLPSMNTNEVQKKMESWMSLWNFSTTFLTGVRVK